MYFLPLLSLALPATASPFLSPRQADRSIDALFKGVGKIYFSAATEFQRFNEGGKTGAIMSANFGGATNEYLMKWDRTEAVRGVCTLDAARELVTWANQNGKSMRGHTLVWGQEDQLPQWVKDITDKDDMRRAIREHIACVVGGFKGQIRAWDVVNEIFADNYPGGFKDTVFYRVLGEEFVTIAFQAARAADPSAKLYINDYGLDNVMWWKFQPGSLVDKVKQWRAAGVPIDGIGSQTHLEAGRSAAVETALRTLAEAAPEVAITELDIEGRNPQEYRQAVEACYHVPTCVGVTVWGVCDVANQGKTLFKNNCDPTDAYYAIADWLKTLQ